MARGGRTTGGGKWGQGTRRPADAAPPTRLAASTALATVALLAGAGTALADAMPFSGPRASDPVALNGTFSSGPILSETAAGGLELVFTQTDSATNETALVGIGVRREGVLEGFSGGQLFNARVIDYANTTIPVEFSLLGVPATPGGAATPAPGARGALLEDLLLNSSIQNPGQAAGLQVGFAGPDGAPVTLVNGAGGDLLVLELSPPVGSIPPSGGDPVQGGDPFGLVDPATGASVDVFSAAYEQFGGNGQAAGNSFFAAVGTNPMVLDNRVASLEELESAALFMVAAPTPTGDFVTVFNLNLYGTVVDLSDLGVAEGAGLDSVTFQSIAPPFGPDLALVAGLPAAGTGGALIEGGVLDLSLLGPVTDDFVLTVLAPAAGAAPFGFVTPPLFTTIEAAITADNAITITGDYLLDGSVPLSTTGAAVAGYVDGLIAAGPGRTTLAALTEISDLGPALLDLGLRQMSPEVHATIPRLFTTTQATAFARGFGNRLDRMDLEAPGAREANGFQFWIDGAGDFSRFDSDAAAGFPEIDLSASNLTVGADYWLTNHLLVGVSGGYSGGQALSEGVDSEFDFDRVQGTVYGALLVGGLRAGASVGYGLGDVESRRSIRLIDDVRTAQGDYDLRHVVAHGEASYRFFLPSVFGREVWVEPQGAATYVYHDQDGFSESGSDGFDLTVEALSVNQVFVTPELRIGTTIPLPDIVLIPEVKGGYRYEVIDDDLTLASRLTDAGGDSFSVEGRLPDRGLITASAGVTAVIQDGIRVFVHYDGLWGDDFTSNAVSGGLQVAF